MAHIKESENFEDYSYFSKRIDNPDAEKITIFVLKSAPEQMHINYTCKKCKHQDSVTTLFNLPFTFSCAKCGANITVAPLKGKKKGIDKKKAKAAKKAKKESKEELEEGSI